MNFLFKNPPFSFNGEGEMGMNARVIIQESISPTYLSAAFTHVAPKA